MTTYNVGNLAETRQRLLSEADSLVAAADGDLAGTALDRFEAIGAELENLARLESSRLSVAEAAAAAGAVERGCDPLDADTAPAAGFNVNRRRNVANPWQALDRGGLSAVDWRAVASDCIAADASTDDAAKQRATTLVERSGVGEYVALVSNPAYARAFMKLACDPLGAQRLDRDEADAVHRVQTRAASLTDAAGGFAVPFALDPTVVVTNAGTSNNIRRIARTVSIASDTWNGVSSTGITASWDAEAAEVSDDAPTLAQPSIPVHKAQAFVPYSVEIGQDWPGFADEMGVLLADARDRLESAAFTLGTGTGQPTGIVTALTGTASEVASATADAYAVGDAYAVSDALPARHWANASWMAHRSIINLTRQFGTADSHAFLAHLDAAQPPLLLGKPLYENSEMDSSVTAASTNFILLVGDFKKYLIVDRVGMSVELVPTLFGANRRPTGQRGLHAWWRTGADSIDDNAFRLLNA